MGSPLTKTSGSAPDQASIRTQYPQESGDYHQIQTIVIPSVTLQFSCFIFSHCEINFAGVRNVKVRPAISTDPNPNPNPNANRIRNRKFSLEMAENNITRSSARLQHCFDPNPQWCRQDLVRGRYETRVILLDISSTWSLRWPIRDTDEKIISYERNTNSFVQNNDWIFLLSWSCINRWHYFVGTN